MSNKKIRPGDIVRQFESVEDILKELQAADKSISDLAVIYVENDEKVVCRWTGDPIRLATLARLIEKHLFSELAENRG